MLKPRAYQAKVSTESGSQLVVEGVAGKTVGIHGGILMIDGDDTIILASGTVEANEELSGAMPFEASGGFTMQPSDDPWFETNAGEGLVIKSGSGADITGLVRWLYHS